jgi:hypothetical protein
VNHYLEFSAIDQAWLQETVLDVAQPSFLFSDPNRPADTLFRAAGCKTKTIRREGQLHDPSILIVVLL